MEIMGGALSLCIMNEKEIIDKINSFREKIAEASKDDDDVLVSLYDANGNLLIKGKYGTGSQEYDDYIYFSEELTTENFNYLTVGHIKRWLAAKSFLLYIWNQLKQKMRLNNIANSKRSCKLQKWT